MCQAWAVSKTKWYDIWVNNMWTSLFSVSVIKTYVYVLMCQLLTCEPVFQLLEREPVYILIYTIIYIYINVSGRAVSKWYQLSTCEPVCLVCQ